MARPDKEAQQWLYKHNTLQDFIESGAEIINPQFWSYVKRLQYTDPDNELKTHKDGKLSAYNVKDYCYFCDERHFENSEYHIDVTKYKETFNDLPESQRLIATIDVCLKCEHTLDQYELYGFDRYEGTESAEQTSIFGRNFGNELIEARITDYLYHGIFPHGLELYKFYDSSHVQHNQCVFCEDYLVDASGETIQYKDLYWIDVPIPGKGHRIPGKVKYCTDCYQLMLYYMNNEDEGFFYYPTQHCKLCGESYDVDKEEIKYRKNSGFHDTSSHLCLTCIGSERWNTQRFYTKNCKDCKTDLYVDGMQYSFVHPAGDHESQYKEMMKRMRCVDCAKWKRGEYNLYEYKDGIYIQFTKHTCDQAQKQNLIGFRILDKSNRQFTVLYSTPLECNKCNCSSLNVTSKEAIEKAAEFHEEKKNLNNYDT